MRLSKAALALAVLLPLAAGCKKQPPPELPPQNKLGSYAFDPASPLENRVTAPPPLVLDFLRAFDERPDYKGYEPSAADKALVLEYLRLLPPVYEKIFKARCVGIYFVPGMLGNGLTDWIAGPDGKIYFHLVLNPSALGKSVSETLTGRERSCFVPLAGWNVRVDAGSKYKGLLYSLAHEGTHGLDYAAGLTPYTDDTMPAYYRPRRPLAGELFRKRWLGYASPRPEFSFPGRDKVTFYGFGGGPKLDISSAPKVYGGMLKGGFISLYASRSWAEELADLATFSALDSLGQPYEIIVTSPGGKTGFKPMASAAGSLTYEAMEQVVRIRD